MVRPGPVISESSTHLHAGHFFACLVHTCTHELGIIKENEFDCIDARGTIAEVGFTTFTLGKNDLHTAQMQSTQVYHLCEVPALKWRRRTLQSLNPLANKFANFDSSKAWKLPKHSRPQMGYLVLCTPKV
jgi:hypothetical protein